jgi:signal transduction histidine kinase
VRTGEPVWIESQVDWALRYPEVAFLHALRRGVAAAIPLVADRSVIGAICLTFPESRRVCEEDRQLALAMADQCAIALERARLYEAEQAARSSAERARLVRDEFLSVAAHELKTPLTSIRLIGQLLARQDCEGPSDPERRRQNVELINQQAARLVVLVDRLFDVSRIDSGTLVMKPERVDLVSVVKEVIEPARARAGSPPIQAHLPQSLAVQADPLRIGQVVSNLLENAIKFSPTGLLIEVDLRQAGAEWVELAIRDHGPGVAVEHREHIFDRFFQADVHAHSPGLGLGLHISRHIVELHGGQLVAEFPPDGGSRFVVRLPMVSPSPSLAAAFAERA